MADFFSQFEEAGTVPTQTTPMGVKDIRGQFDSRRVALESSPSTGVSQQKSLTGNFFSDTGAFVKGAAKGVLSKAELGAEQVEKGGKFLGKKLAEALNIKELNLGEKLGLSPEEVQSIQQEWGQSGVEEVLETEPGAESYGKTAGSLAGDIALFTGGQALAKTAVSKIPQIAQLGGKAAKVAGIVAGGVGGTTAMTAIPEGRLPTTGEVALGVAAEGLVPPIAGAIGRLAGKAGKALKGLTSEEAKVEIGRAVEEGIEKGVRPSLSGKQTPQQMTTFKEKAKEAVETIVDQKDKLNLVDEFGEVTGGLPQNLKQFTQAIDQSKRNIFNEYNALTKAAGKTGAELNLKPIADELDKISGSKVLMAEKPEIVDYAAKRALRYKDLKYTPEEAEEAIRIANESLERFYKSGSYDDFSKSYIDSMIANRLRGGLDELIEGATGTEYQVLKNKYGSLKSIEKDVNHRALIEARKAPKGLLDMTDVFTGGDVVLGLTSANPAYLAKAAVQKGIKEWFKFLNNPNTSIKRMFDQVENLKGRIKPEVPKPPSPPTTKPPSPKGEAGQSAKTTGLEQEAKKYKSAEEFVKAKTNVYHGTSDNFTEFKLQNGRELGPNAIFVSPQNEVASYYAQGIGKGGKGKVMGLNLSDSKLFDYSNKQHLSKINDFIDKNYSTLADKMKLNTEYATKDYLKKAISKGDYTYLEDPAVQKFIKDSGYDGFKIKDYTGGDGIGIFDVSALKTKSQLTDLWNKANNKANQ